MKVILSQERLSYDIEIDSEDLKRLIEEGVIILRKK